METTTSGLGFRRGLRTYTRPLHAHLDSFSFSGITTCQDEI